MPDDLRSRAEAIRFRKSDIARDAGLPPDTVGRTLNNRTDPRRSTTDKIAAAIEAEELRLLAHLRALHPTRADAA